MNKTTTFYKGHTITSASVTAGYLAFYNQFTGKRIRLLCIDAVNQTTTSRIGLYYMPLTTVTPIFLAEDIVGPDHHVVWTGSMIIDDPWQIGAHFYHPKLADNVYIRLIWEEI